MSQNIVFAGFAAISFLVPLAIHVFNRGKPTSFGHVLQRNIWPVLLIGFVVVVHDFYRFGFALERWNWGWLLIAAAAFFVGLAIELLELRRRRRGQAI